jgi:YD repeat-containing protein
MPNPTIGNESQFTPSYAWGNGFSSFDIDTQTEALLAGKNPTFNATQFTPSLVWGNGFSSFNIDTQTEALLAGKNPTTNATRRGKSAPTYDAAGRLTGYTDNIISQFSTYGQKFSTDPEQTPEYEAYAYTPAGTDAYLIPLNSTQQAPQINANVNSTTMAGVQNTNKQFGVGTGIRSGINAAIGVSGIAAVSPISNTLLNQAGLVDATYATAPFNLLNNKIGIGGQGIAVPYPDFRTRKFSLTGKSVGQAAAGLLDRRIDGFSAQTRSETATAGAYAALAATIGPYNVFNLDATYGWGSHDSPTAMRNDFTMRSNVASTWDFKELRAQSKLRTLGTGKEKIGRVLTQTKNVIEKITPFRGDRVTVIDFGRRTWKDIYRWLPGETKGDFGNFAAKTADILGVNPYGTTKDFVKFFFTGPSLHAGSQNSPDDVIVFRAILSSLSDQFSPSWSPVNILGRADSNYHYGGYSRTVDLGFTVYATDRDELKFIYRKLNALAGYTAPEYTTDSFALKGPWIRVTIGDYFISQPAVIESLSYTFVDSDTTWEINIEEDPEMKQVTHKIDVSMGLTMITDYLPQKGGAFYTFAPINDIGVNGAASSTSKGGWLNDFRKKGPIGTPNASPGSTGQEQEL